MAANSVKLRHSSKPSRKPLNSHSALNGASREVAFDVGFMPTPEMIIL
jgi:hypothetical protein